MESVKTKKKRGQVPGMKDRLRELMLQYGNSTAFSKALGISRQTVGFWLSGDRVPDAANLLVISEKTGKSVEWLLGKAPFEKQTADKELRFVRDYTGLSEDAVQFLHKLCPNNGSYDDKRKSILETISFLLENTSFYRMVLDETRFARICADRRDKWAGIIEYGDLSEEELGTVEALNKKQYTVLDASEMADYQRDRAAKAYSDFLNQSLSNFSEGYYEINSLLDRQWLNDSMGVGEEG